MHSRPEEAEAAFYAAFESANLEQMMRVWDEADDIACVHPLGERLEGRTQIFAGWEKLFAQGARMSFRIRNVRQIRTEGLAVHLVHEQISVPGREEPALVLATNVYRRSDAGWRMVLHHASPGGRAQSDDAPPVLH